MIVSDAKLVDGKMVLVNTIEVEQSKLTADCWLIQFRGLGACTSCQCFNAKTGKVKTRGPNTCGGGETLKRLLAKGGGAI